MNISPEHRPLRLYRPWWSRPPLALILGVLLSSSCAALALVAVAPEGSSRAALSSTHEFVKVVLAAARGAS